MTNTQTLVADRERAAELITFMTETYREYAGIADDVELTVEAYIGADGAFQLKLTPKVDEPEDDPIEQMLRRFPGIDDPSDLTGDWMDCDECGSVPQTWSGVCPACDMRCE